MEGAQWKTPGHINVHQGVEAEAEAMAGGRGMEDHNGGFSGLQETFGDSVRF